MAKMSVVQRNLRRIGLSRSYAVKRAALKAKIYDKFLSLEERFQAQMALAKMPRDASVVRVRNRCELTGRGRGYYRKFRLSRICIRELASTGELTGVKKSSW